MGNPRKRRKGYATPPHPWNKERIDEEKELIRSYGLKNKKEVWRATSLLRKFTSQAKKLTSSTAEDRDVEIKQFLEKLKNIGLLEDSSQLEDVLTISTKDILERRLQTLAYKKNVARSIKQARQFIVHRHVKIADKVVTTPGYIASKDQENKITFSDLSSLNDIDHPERAKEEKKEPKPKEKKGNKKKEKAKK